MTQVVLESIDGQTLATIIKKIVFPKNDENQQNMPNLALPLAAEALFFQYLLFSS